MDLQGTIELIGQTETVGSNGFTKRLLLISTNEQYSQKLPIDFIKEKCSILDNYKVGESVKVSVNLRGSEYNGKYYSQIQGWRIEKLQTDTLSENNTPIQPTQGYAHQNNIIHNNVSKEEDLMDLPF